ncbi:unnamed protein product, partial [Discosporangium mesarthrocarpum]
MSTVSRSSRHSNGGSFTGKKSTAVAKYRDVCPASRTDEELIDLVKRMSGDEEKIQTALEDWWQHDQGEWVVTSKKKKPQQRAGVAGGGGGGGYANGRGQDDRRGGRGLGGLSEKMRGV